MQQTNDTSVIMRAVTPVVVSQIVTGNTTNESLESFGIPIQLVFVTEEVRTTHAFTRYTAKSM